MSETQLAFSRVLRQLVGLGLFYSDIEPLDAGIERRFKGFWEHTPCPPAAIGASTSGNRLTVLCAELRFRANLHLRHAISRGAPLQR